MWLLHPGAYNLDEALLDRNPSPKREDIVRALSKHICRCTGYIKIVDAVMLASKRLQGLQTAAVNRTGVVGSSVARTDAGSKVLGAAQFGADLNRKDQLYARVFRSDRHHARVLSVDVSQAVAVPGVEAVLTAPDVPGSNRIGYVLRDQPVLAGDKVRRIGDPIAVVAAATEESAAAALGKIRVEYESLPPVLDPSEAIRPGAVAVHEQGNVLRRRYVVRGSVEDGFDRADVIVEDTYVTPFAEHAYLEPEARLAFLDEEGSVVVQSSTQNPVLVQSDVAHALGLHLDQVRAIPSVIGGGFGGKLDAGLEVLLALVAFKLRKPVKMVFSRSESFLASIKKHPSEFSLDWEQPATASS